MRSPPRGNHKIVNPGERLEVKSNGKNLNVTTNAPKILVNATSPRIDYSKLRILKSPKGQGSLGNEE